MNHRKFFVATSAVFLGLACVSGQAMTRKAGLNACAQALAVDLGKGRGHAPEVRLDERSDRSTRPLETRNTVYLDASDPESGAVVGRYDCVLNARAEVLELIALPLDAADANTRSFEFD
jgi:hypothetical protein